MSEESKMASLFQKNPEAWGVINRPSDKKDEDLLLQEVARQEVERRKKFKRTFGGSTLLERLEESMGQ